MLFSKNAFIAVTTTDLDAMRAFWVDKLGCSIAQEEVGEFLMVDAGGTRLCFDLPDGNVHRVSYGSDVVVGLKIASIEDALRSLHDLHILIQEGPKGNEGRQWLRVADPDGRAIILTEGD